MDEKIDNITEGELVAALLAAQMASETPIKGAMTTYDLAQEIGCSVRWVRVQLRPLIAGGQIEPVRVQTTDIAGRRTTVPAYRLKVKKEAENVN